MNYEEDHKKGRSQKAKGKKAMGYRRAEHLSSR
ncbi:hypothetical protein JOD20_003871 [Herpetosiphon giganteus]|nr:hypothetical protein [Herpetosiphon giganteus]